MTTASTVNCSIAQLPKVLAVELEVRGHHADYIRNFANTWIEREFPAHLEFLVTRPFLKYHTNIVDHFRHLSDKPVSLHVISEEEQARLDLRPRLKYWNGWKLFCKYAEQLESSYGLLMYSDYFQLPVCIGKKSPCPFSAIYFRPTFHYHTFLNFRPTLKQRFVAWRKAMLLGRFLKNPELKELYCLDPEVVPYIRRTFTTEAEISHIADSFCMAPGSQHRADALRRDLGIDSDRTVFCLLGVLDSRKGTRQLLQAVQHINHEVGKQVCILLLGYVPDHESVAIETLAKEMNGVSSVQVIIRNQYIEATEVQHYYALSDVILTTYQNHMGSSSALIRAALAKKPVLSSDFGLMGHLVRTRKLGHVCDSTSPPAIAAAIERILACDLSRVTNSFECEKLVAENSEQQLGHDLSRLVDLLPSVATGITRRAVLQ